jgi:hypothetical protein
MESIVIMSLDVLHMTSSCARMDLVMPMAPAVRSLVDADAARRGYTYREPGATLQAIVDPNATALAFTSLERGETHPRAERMLS